MEITGEELNILKNIIQDSNINFLIGSGLSVPYFPTLGNIEVLLTDLEKDQKLSKQKKQLLKTSIYKSYFDTIIYKNLELIEEKTNSVLDNYKEFLTVLNTLLLKRKSTILGKQINIFTTNIDIFFESAFEQTNIEVNDGFNGRFKPVFETGNFKKIHFKKSLHYDNTSEIPVFNLIKIHGSLTWEIGALDRIFFSSNLNKLKEIQQANPDDSACITISKTDTLSDLESKIPTGKFNSKKAATFLGQYERLSIVNPDKSKFKHTLLNQTYYDLLRIYSNELEKENTVLFVLGFSFCDEHIRDLTIRVANSNPTLVIYVFGHSTDSLVPIRSRFDPRQIKNNNIRFIEPTKDKLGKDEFHYDFQSLNDKIFKAILKKVGEINN